MKRYFSVILTALVLVLAGTSLRPSTTIDGARAITGSIAVAGVNYCADASGSGTTYTCTITGLSAYTAGMVVTFVPQTASSGASTLNITGTSTLGAKTIDMFNCSTALVTDDLIAGGRYTLTYNGTVFCKMEGPATAWTGLSYSNSWVDGSNPNPPGQFRKLNDGRICVRGFMTGGTRTAGTTVFTLPAGYRGTYNEQLLFIYNAGAEVPNRLLMVAATGVTTLNVTETVDTNIAISGGEQCWSEF